MDRTEYRRQYYLKNKERILSKSKQYYADHREECIARNSDYRSRVNPDRKTEWREYYDKHAEAHRERTRAYNKTEDGKASVSAAIKRYAANYPERIRANQLAKKIPSQPCAVCSDERTHRHHPDYSKPMEVVFLCALHHRQLHVGRLNLETTQGGN